MEEERKDSPDESAGDRADRHLGKPHRAPKIIALVVIAVASLLLGLFVLNQPQTYGLLTSSLDAKRNGVLGLIGACSGASMAIGAVPGDATTPLANQIASLDGDLLVVLAAIFLEKYLLTTIGFLVFAILVPVACILYAVTALLSEDSAAGRKIASLARKLLSFGIAIFLVVPASVLISNMIEDTYEVSTEASVQKLQESVEAIGEGGSAGDSGSESDGDGNGIVGSIASALKGAAGAVASVGQAALDAIGQALNIALESVAVLIVTSCLIPILVLVLFLWFAHLILGIDTSAPMNALKPRPHRGKGK